MTLSNWDISNVIDMNFMFKGCKMEYFYPIKETIIVDKIVKCIICLEEKDIYNKLCNKDKENDHYYCDDCLEQSKNLKCCICKTKPYWVRYNLEI